MKREILFKAKRLDNGEWVEGSVTHNRLGDAFITPIDAASHLDAIQVDPETVCQYAGLKDKNGVKIFEGDKVQVFYKNRGELSTYRTDIVWTKRGIRVSQNKTAKTPYLATQNIKEVIGSIHD